MDQGKAEKKYGVNPNELKYFTCNRLAETLNISSNVMKQILSHVRTDTTDSSGKSTWLLIDVLIPISNYLQYGYDSIGVSEEALLNPNKMSPKNRKEHWAAEKIKDEVKLIRGELLRKDEVRQDYASLVKTVVAGIDSIADRLERDCGLLPNQVETVIEVTDLIRDSIAENVIYDD